MNDIAETALMFTHQAAKYADREVFHTAEAFDILHDTVEVFGGTHFQSMQARRNLVEAVNIALSSIPGNQVSVRCAELTGGTYFIEWLPYAMRPAKAG